MQHVDSILNVPDGTEGLAKEDATIRQRAHYDLRILAEYAKALAAVRASGVVDHKTYRNGM